MRNKREELARVAQQVDQLVDQTVDLLVRQTRYPNQLVLNVTREQALRGLQELLHDELSSAHMSSERCWRIVSCILASSVAYLVQTLSDPIACVRRREQPVVVSCRKTALLVAESCEWRAFFDWSRAIHQASENAGRAQAVGPCSTAGCVSQLHLPDRE